MRTRRTTLISCLCLVMTVGYLRADGFQAGIARKVITPPEPIWLGGYANRTKPAEGKDLDLFVKVLAIQDPAGQKFVLLTSDLLGLPRQLSEAVCAEVTQKTGLARERLMLTSSHTHCGPVLRGILTDMYGMPPEEMAKIGAYTERLRHWMVETIVAALQDLRPARFSYGASTARFAVNRRNNAEKDVPRLLDQGGALNGPVDHDVPVLRVETPDGKLRAIVFGYACHNTTLSYYRWSGDYAGYAQAFLEEKNPGAQAMFWMGCGGDANPLPRRTVELCRKYGRELADAVDAALTSRMTPLQGAWTGRYAAMSLPLAELPTKDKLAADMLSKQPAQRKRAERLLALLQKGAKIDDAYPFYPVQVWKLGAGPLWIALGGEVVVDYSLRLKKELKRSHPVWVTAYANDVMAYIPSERVLKEGGYEGESAMVYYGLPSKWATGVEERIVAKAHELVEAVK